jgi:hypothetical protein
LLGDPGATGRVVPAEKKNEATHRDWRGLGFFYERICNDNRQ